MSEKGETRMAKKMVKKEARQSDGRDRVPRDSQGTAAMSERCRRCGEEIIWCLTENLNRISINVKQEPLGKLTGKTAPPPRFWLEIPLDRTKLPIAHLDAKHKHDGAHYVSHFARCPKQVMLRRSVRFFYDVQRARLAAEGRLTKKATSAKIQLHEEDMALLAIRTAETHRLERQLLKDLKGQLNEIPFYVQVLKGRYRGLGPTMAAVILSSFDIELADNPSKMWAFAGLAVEPAVRCRACQSVLKKRKGQFIHTFKWGDCAKGKVVQGDETYASGKSQRPKRREKNNYSAWLRMKLAGVLGEVLIKLNSPVRKFYDDYKHRLESANWGMQQGHRHNAARRYMVKMLILDIWREWRKFEGLPVRNPYPVEYLGKKFHGETDVVEPEGYVHGKRATPLEATRMNERAISQEITTQPKRANGAEATRKDERAIAQETTRAFERARREETTSAGERAIDVEIAAEIELAMDEESTSAAERATSSETTSRHERAKNAETTSIPERAISREIPKNRERATMREIQMY